MYERIWDEADYVIPPSENNAFFVMTNVIVTPNQTRTHCPEDHIEIPDIICGDPKRSIDRTQDSKTDLKTCIKDRIISHKSHGKETGNCVKSDKEGGVYACEISGWCPVERDILPTMNQPLLKRTEEFTVFIKNAISFPWFDKEKFNRHNMPNGICRYKPHDKSTWLCPIFRFKDIVEMAKGYFSNIFYGLKRIIFTNIQRMILFYINFTPSK